jgi:hypothetical protein
VCPYCMRHVQPRHRPTAFTPHFLTSVTSHSPGLRLALPLNAKGDLFVAIVVGCRQTSRDVAATTSGFGPITKLCRPTYDNNGCSAGEANDYEVDPAAT